MCTRGKQDDRESMSRLIFVHDGRTLKSKCEFSMDASRLRRADNAGTFRGSTLLTMKNTEQQRFGMRSIVVFTPAWTKFMWHREPRVCIWIRDETHPYFFLYDRVFCRAWNRVPDVARRSDTFATTRDLQRWPMEFLSFCHDLLLILRFDYPSTFPRQ